MSSHLLCVACLVAFGADPVAMRAARLAEMPLPVAIDDPSAQPLAGMLNRDLRDRRRAVIRADVAAWESLKSADDWGRFRDERIGALRRSIGDFSPPPIDLRARVTRSHSGDGFRLDCVVFESRSGLSVTANLYRPVPPRDAMPGVLIAHSHHRPKSEGELQEMGITWARAGCLVLVPDLLGHGERRQHPFRTAADWPTSFRVERQDYYFRYNVGMQLHLAGDSLIGWIAWDLSRCVDLLLAQPGIDPRRIALLGAVAGGGDLAAVAAALDPRIAVAVPFNFGGPQPESEYPLPADAASSFNYVGGGSWESTRNLTQSASGGFLPWVIVGAMAPRPLVYAHEFSWDRERDPVWRRLETIYKWHAAPDKLAETHGWGRVSQSSGEASHCNNIGRPHRRAIHEAFERWLRIPTPELECATRFESRQLACVEGVASAADLRLTPVHELARDVARTRGDAFRAGLAKLPPDQRRRQLQDAWRGRLGIPAVVPPARFSEAAKVPDAPRSVRGWLKTERDLIVPVLLLLPDQAPPQGSPVAVIVSQAGHAGLVKRRAVELAELLERGVAVCLPDLRGCGATQPDEGRGRRSSATALSSSELMLGGTLLGGQLYDLLTVVHWLAQRSEVSSSCIGVWGESLAAANGADVRIDVPHDAGPEPKIGEPGAGMLALLVPLFDERVTRVVSRGMLVSFASLLESPFIHVPHDVVVPGILTVGDLADVAAATTPDGLRIEQPIEGTNRWATQPNLESAWSSVISAYAAQNAASRLQLGRPTDASDTAARWLADGLLGDCDSAAAGVKSRP